MWDLRQAQRNIVAHFPPTGFHFVATNDTYCLCVHFYVCQAQKTGKIEAADFLTRCSNANDANITHFHYSFSHVLHLLPASDYLRNYSSILQSNKKDLNLKTLELIFTICNFLLFVNSCLNPVIYSKLHERIFNCIKRYIGAWTGSCRKKFNCFKKLLTETISEKHHTYKLSIM